ncbi:hypothetical protein Tco_0493139 [Tanacetum coccineum]
MWETFKQVKINLPLIDAIKQIPAYAKFLKDLCTQKRKLKATLPKKIDLTEHVSVVLSTSLPLKFKDPRAPMISVMVGNIAIKKALLDLGVSINILPASLVDKYDLGTLRKTVDDFYYPVDFFVMNTESPYQDVQPTIILGKLRLNVFNSLNSPTSNDSYHIDIVGNLNGRLNNIWVEEENMRKMVMMKMIEDLNNEKDEKKWQSMVLEMKIEEIVCSKREIPARV